MGKKRRWETLLLLAATVLLVGACMEDEPNWEGMAMVSHAEAQASRAKTEANQAEARIYTEQARVAQAKAEAALAQAQATNATANAEYAHTLRDAIGGLVGVANHAQALLSVQMMFPYLIIAGLVVVVVIFGLLGMFLLRYQTAQVNAQRALIESFTQWAAPMYRLGSGERPLLIRPGVRAERQYGQHSADTQEG